MPETPDAKNRLEKPNYTQIPNSWLDNAVPQIASAAELKVTLALFRQTFGWHGKQQSQIRLTCTQIAKLAGLKKTGAFEGINAALKRGLVYRVQTGPQSFAYGLQIGDEEMPLDVKEPFIPKNNTSNLTEEPSVRANGCEEPSVRANGTVRQGERLGDESLYMKEREIHGAARKKTGQQGRRVSLPTAVVERGVLCPEGFSPTAELRSWAEKRLPPATVVRLDALTEQFVRKFREVERLYLRDEAAWRARWQNYMQTCGDNDLQRAERRGAAGGGAGGGAAEDYSPSYDDLVKAGVLSPVADSPAPAASPTGVAPAGGGGFNLF